MSDGMESSNSGGQGQQVGAEGSPQGSKGAVYSYSGAVAQRALFAPYRRRSTGRKVGARDSKSAPSRLSKVSAAENTAS